MRKRTIITVSILLAVVAVLIVLSPISYRIALHKLESSPGKETFLCREEASDGEFRIVAQHCDGQVRGAWLKKGFAGVWYSIADINTANTADGTASLAWLTYNGSQFFDDGRALETTFGAHLLFCGNNAIKRIEIPEDALPGNVSVNIWQLENAYILDFAAGGEELSGINCTELLQELGCIE